MVDKFKGSNRRQACEVGDLRKHLGKSVDATPLNENLLNAFIITSTALVLGVSVLSVMYAITILFNWIVGG